MALQIHQKLLDRPAKQPDPSQMTHVESKTDIKDRLKLRLHNFNLVVMKTNSLRNLLDQIHALEIDTAVKRLMTDSCLSLIETSFICKNAIKLIIIL